MYIWHIWFLWIVLYFKIKWFSADFGDFLNGKESHINLPTDNEKKSGEKLSGISISNFST